MDNVIDCLAKRGLVDSLSSEDLRKMASTPMKAYVGFDPTADSLHIGHLLGIVVLAWLQKYGHTPVVVLGGATGRIGDPSGKSKERPLLDVVTIESNIASIRKQFEKILDFSSPSNAPIIVNNDSWFKDFSFIDFLRDVGKHFRLGPMLAKDSVRTRLESEEGMSFTEFSYQLLQSYDFYHLYSTYGVNLQMGGSDQWGNITAGIDLVRKLKGEAVYGLTFPLLTKNDGKKFGKSEEGAIWLSEERCSVYQFYQYLVRIADADVIKMMRMLTFMDLDEIQEIEQSMQESSYVPNTAQKRLAEEITTFVHGKAGLEKALKVTEGAGPGSNASLSVEVLEEIAKDMPHVTLSKEQVIGKKMVEVAVVSGLLPSKGEAVRLIQNGGAYLNNVKVEDVHLVIASSHLIGDRYLLIASGKKKKLLITVQ